MGKVTAISFFHNNGTMRRSVDPVEVHEINEQERSEFEYAYDPQLLPPLQPSSDGMWRYKHLLPTLEPVLYPLFVGGTPMIASTALREYIGITNLWLKDETRSPTGSNKDRATALIVNQALHTGINTISCASTGNVAVSLAIGAAAAAIKAVIFVPATVSKTKLQLMLFAGATVFRLEEGYEAAVKLSRLAAHSFGWYDRNTGYNPLSLEAKKTVALEIWEQLGHQVPDVVVVPVGDGVTLNGIAKGFRELIACKATDRLPRIIAVQAEGCQPIKLAWDGNEPTQPMQAMTIADGIAVTSPINGAMVLRDIRLSKGSVIAVSDKSILQAMHVLATKGGILAEPAGAAAFAGLELARASKLFTSKECVVVLVTGTGLKNLHYLQPQESCQTYDIKANLEDVERVIQRIHP